MRWHLTLYSGHRLVIPLPLASQCWEYRSILPHLAVIVDFVIISLEWRFLLPLRIKADNPACYYESHSILIISQDSYDVCVCVCTHV